MLVLASTSIYARFGEHKASEAKQKGDNMAATWLWHLIEQIDDDKDSNLVTAATCQQQKGGSSLAPTCGHRLLTH